MKPSTDRSRHSGFALATVLVFLLILTVTMFVASGLTMIDMRVVTNIADEKRSVSIAEAGLNETLKRLSLTAPTDMTVDGNTFNAAFAAAAGSGNCSGANDYCPDATNPAWNAKILFDDGLATVKAGNLVTTRTVQTSASRLDYSTSSDNTPDNGTLTLQWNCIVGTPPCGTVGNIRELFNLPVLDIIATGTEHAASRKVTLSVIPGVPGLGTYDEACPPNGVKMVGAVQIAVTGTVQVNSPCAGGGDGYAIDGNGGTLVQTAGQMNVVGDVSPGDHATSPDLNIGAPSQNDPLGPSKANLLQPCFGTLTTNCRNLPTDYPAPTERNYANNPLSGTDSTSCPGTRLAPKVCNVDGGPDLPGVTINPGIYYGGLTFKGKVTLNPGIYIIAGGGIGVKSGMTTVSGDGVMIFNTQSDNELSINTGSCAGGNTGGICAVDTSGTPTLTLTSPSAGYYQGIVFFQARVSDGVATQPKVTLQGGNSNKSLLDGLIYAVDASIDFKGGINVAGNILVGNMTANGNVNITKAASNTPLIAQKAGFTQVVAWKDF